MKRNWVILLVLAGVLLVLLIGVLIQPMKIMIAKRQLDSQDTRVRQMAVELLLQSGMKGRVILLDALERDSDRWQDLVKMIKSDLEAGRDIAPIIRAAVEALRQGGPAAEAYARAAAEGWPLGLLDEPTKREIIAQFMTMRLKVRDVYPLGKGTPRFLCHWRQDGSTVLRFTLKSLLIVDGKPDSHCGPLHVGKSEGGTMGFGSGADKITNALGRHSVQGKVEATLTEFATDGKFQATEQPGWTMTAETPVVEFTVRDDLPADYLQAAVTPEIEQAIAKAVRTQRKPNRSWESQLHVNSVGIPAVEALIVSPALPVDLAYRERWIDVETGEEWDDSGGTLVKGQERTGYSIDPPRKFMETLPLGNCTRTFRLILEPSFERALDDPEVKAYWPRPIELPEFAIDFEVKKKGE